MTPEEFKQKMLDIFEIGYEETMHEKADGLMCELLTELGYKDGVEVFYNMDKWYS